MKKKTQEEFEKEVYDLVGEEYVVLGEYKNNTTKIKVRHTKCNHEYEVIPSKFLIGKNKCPKCFKSRSKTTGQFKEEVFDLVGDEYTVLGEYINNKTKIKIKHNKCNHEYEVTPKDFKRGTRCPKCFGNSRKTTKIFKQEIYNLVGNEYTVLGEYINTKTKIKMKHNKCNHEYEVAPYNFLTKTRCPKCFGAIKKTTELFKEEVYNLVSDEYTVLSEYINNETKIMIKHNKCNHKYEVTPSKFLSGTRCPKCFGKNKKTTEQFKEEVYNLVSDEYTVLSEYINNKTKVKMKHNKCNYEYEVSPSKFLSGNRCPKCQKSKAVLKITDLLIKNLITFTCEYRFKDCKYKSQLPFDFAIFNNDKLILLIEYDGIQHYKPIGYFGGSKGLKETKLRDNIKTQYCRENNIPLLRIPYWEADNIHKILLKKLFRLGLI